MLETLEVQVEGTLHVVNINHYSSRKCIVYINNKEILLVQKRYAWRKIGMYGARSYDNIIREVINELERRERQKRYPDAPDYPDQTMEVVSAGKTYSIRLIELEEKKFEAILTDDYRVMIYWNGVKWKVQGQGSRMFVDIWEQVLRELNRREVGKRSPEVAQYQKENPIETVEVKVRGETHHVKVSPLEEGRYEAVLSSVDRVNIFWNGKRWQWKGVGSKRNKDIWAAVVRKIGAKR